MAKKAKAKRAGKAAAPLNKARAKRKTKSSTKSRTMEYPIAETLAWVADGEKLLIKWGAIQSPGAKRIASGVAKVLSVLQALTALRKM